MNKQISMQGHALPAVFFGAAVLMTAWRVSAQTSIQMFSAGPKFQETSGEALYQATCQGCHMAQGEGAHWAGSYPALARNPRLASADYAVNVVLNGQKGMPAFGKMMSDEQIAAVVGYARSHFGNEYPDTIRVEGIKDLRR
jgi:mono/diheme cytochrome c family protein